MLPVETGQGPQPAANQGETLSPSSAPDLLSSVCHDLKAPLASIAMGAGFLRKCLSPEDLPAQRVVQALHRAADRMSQLITSFADLGRLETHQLELQVGTHDLGAIVKAALEQYAPDAKEQDVAVSLELEPGLPMVWCDRDRMQQIVSHLMAAALRIVPARATVVAVVDSQAGGTRVQLVARRGPDTRRLDAERLPKPALALARGLIALHQGSLEVAVDGDTLTLAFVLPRGPS